MRLWAAQSVSAGGTRITRTALPVIAVLSLTGSPGEVAVLAALTYGPAFVVGLLAGGWVDRGRKRDILVSADLVRAAVVASVPLAAWLGVLHVAHVYVVAVLVGAATSVFQIADVALLPQLVPPERIVDGNSKLATTEALAEVTGPAVAGLLIQGVGAPFAVLLDAASYVWSASFLRTLRPREPGVPASDQPRPESRGIWSAARVLGHDVRIGMRVSFGHPVVGPLFAATGLLMLSAGFFAALYMLYTLRTLGLSPAAVGSIIGVGGVGALAGTALARALPPRLGAGPTLVLSLGVYQLGSLLIPLAGMPFVPRGGVPVLLVAQQLLGDAFFMSFFILSTSLRQSLLPEDVLGRVNATLQVVNGALLPFGALVAGPLAGLLGVRETLWLGAALGLFGPVLLVSARAVRRVSLAS